MAYLEGKKIVLLSDYAKSNKLSHSNLINKATRQTIEAFLEKGVWKISENFSAEGGSASGGNAPKLTVLTWDEKREAEKDGLAIQFKPLWEWLLEKPQE